MNRSSRASAVFRVFLNSAVRGFSLYSTTMLPGESLSHTDEVTPYAQPPLSPDEVFKSGIPAMDSLWRKIYLVGLGAIGATYLAALYDVQPDSIRVIVDPERRAFLERDPIQVNGRAYRFSMVSPGEQCEVASLILVAVKARQLEDALVSASAFIDKDTIVISLMNGLPAVEAFRKHVDLNRILVGVVYTYASRIGNLIQSHDRGELILGPISTSFSRERMDSLQRLFERAGISCKVSPDIYRAAWEKYLINTSLNQISGVLMATYGQLNSSPHAHKLLYEVGGELLQLAKATGIRLTDQALVKLFRLLASLPPEGKTSMLQDLEAGRRTEVEAFAGEVIRLGREHGVGTPNNLILFHMLRFLEQRSASSDLNQVTGGDSASPTTAPLSLPWPLAIGS